jgi:hypothetical protein
MGFKYFVRSPLAFCIDLFTLHANSVLLLYFPFMFRIPSSVLTTNTFIALFCSLRVLGAKQCRSK